MDNVPLVISSTSHSISGFWNSIYLYHDRPHLVNKKLSAIAPVFSCELTNCKNPLSIFTWEALIYEIRKLSSLTQISSDFFRKITDQIQVEETQWTCIKNRHDGIFISVRILIPRKYQNKSLEFVFIDKNTQLVTFFAVQELANNIAPRFPYSIKLTRNGSIRINLQKYEDADTEAAEWIADKLFEKLLKWTEDYNTPAITSLSLVDNDDYYCLYNKLKDKYGLDLVNKWSEKAKTDPLKFVFEDIAIASYLITFWRKTNQKNVNFVDCGCGNGLLVYLLNKEGYRGFGIDIRRRNSWDLYPDVDLRVGTITPKSLFSEATWLIGNHSDELTPWIPIITSKSSLQTNYFLIPCCPHDFNGQKYSRVNTKLSQYEDYLNYIKQISSVCKFETLIDKLRIPSTKRTCIIGIRNNCNKFNQDEVNNFVAEKLKTEFKVKSSHEIVRNCTQLDKNFLKKIVSLIVGELLKEQNFQQKSFNDEVWNQGGKKMLSELSLKLSIDDRKQLKNECGGLQTLLKNHKYIFKVAKGYVELQKPLHINKSQGKYKDKKCWFLINHPNGCFYDSESCAYFH